MLWWRLHHLAHLLSAARMQWLGPCWRLSLPTEPRWQIHGSWGCETAHQHLPTAAFQHSLPPPRPLRNTRHSPSGLQPLDQGSRRLPLPHKPVFLSVDFSQSPPACLAFPASSDSASVGLRAATRGRSVTASSQHTPSSPPSPPSSSSHCQGSTRCCLSADSYPPAATLNLGSATASLPRYGSNQPSLQDQRHQDQP